MSSVSQPSVVPAPLREPDSLDGNKRRHMRRRCGAATLHDDCRPVICGRRHRVLRTPAPKNRRVLAALAPDRIDK